LQFVKSIHKYSVGSHSWLTLVAHPWFFRG
jgi:hypothetical protein